MKKHLQFLTEHQPMPSDREVSEEECSSFVEAIEYFKTNTNPECVALFLGTISNNTSLGMYESIEQVLANQSRETVKFEIAKSLKSHNEPLIYRCCSWAAGLGLWELINEIKPFVSHANEDVALSATDFVELKSELSN
jgi:hypothetical protein